MEDEHPPPPGGDGPQRLLGGAVGHGSMRVRSQQMEQTLCLSAHCIILHLWEHPQQPTRKKASTGAAAHLRRPSNTMVFGHSRVGCSDPTSCKFTVGNAVSIPANIAIDESVKWADERRAYKLKKKPPPPPA